MIAESPEAYSMRVFDHIDEMLEAVRRASVHAKNLSCNCENVRAVLGDPEALCDRCFIQGTWELVRPKR